MHNGMVFFSVLLSIVLCACGSEYSAGQTHDEGSSDSDADADSDTDADADTDSDADSDGDTDADADSDADSDGDSDSDTDTDTDTDSDSDTDMDIDIDSDSDTDTDTETGTETDTDDCTEDCDKGYYSQCSCAPDDPCGWIEDGFCDNGCDTVLDDPLDDAIDCACYGQETERIPTADADADADTEADVCEGDEIIELPVADARFVPPMIAGTSTQNEGMYCVTEEAYAGQTIWSCVDIPCAGDWYAMAKAIKNGDNGDSFYLTVGDHPKVTWDIFQCSGPDQKWDWDYVSAAAGDGAECNADSITDPAPFPLEKGTIQITLGGREHSGSQTTAAVSRILLVTNPDLPFTPE